MAGDGSGGRGTASFGEFSLQQPRVCEGVALFKQTLRMNEMVGRECMYILADLEGGGLAGMLSSQPNALITGCRKVMMN
jgi:hypothetical protein